ncbi:MAG: hypothetical protein AAGB26_16570 [Planctomycetota bacterium]
MSEFLDAITSPVNFGLTVLLACFMMYWAVVLIGMIDIEALDFDFDVDADADVDINTSTAGSGASGLMSLLKFLNVGEVPVMILLSVFLLIIWTIGVLAHMLIGSWSIAIQLLALIPMGIGAALLTKILTQPVKKVFAKMDESASAGSVSVMGQRCRVISATVDHQHGQAEIDTGASPVKINVKTPEEGAVLKRGDEAVVVQERDDKGVYIIRGF